MQGCQMEALCDGRREGPRMRVHADRCGRGVSPSLLLPVLYAYFQSDTPTSSLIRPLPDSYHHSYSWCRSPTLSDTPTPTPSTCLVTNSEWRCIDLPSDSPDASYRDNPRWWNDRVSSIAFIHILRLVHFHAVGHHSLTQSPCITRFSQSAKWARGRWFCSTVPRFT